MGRTRTGTHHEWSSWKAASLPTLATQDTDMGFISHFTEEETAARSNEIKTWGNHRKSLAPGRMERVALDCGRERSGYTRPLPSPSLD